MIKDPVCGRAVAVSEAADRSEFGGGTYYFCGPQCQQKFDADPRRFAAAPAQRSRVPCCGFGIVRSSIQRGEA